MEISKKIRISFNKSQFKRLKDAIDIIPENISYPIYLDIDCSQCNIFNEDNILTTDMDIAKIYSQEQFKLKQEFRDLRNGYVKPKRPSYGHFTFYDLTQQYEKEKVVMQYPLTEDEVFKAENSLKEACIKTPSTLQNYWNCLKRIFAKNKIK